MHGTPGLSVNGQPASEEAMQHSLAGKRATNKFAYSGDIVRVQFLTCKVTVCVYALLVYANKGQNMKWSILHGTQRTCFRM